MVRNKSGIHRWNEINVGHRSCENKVGKLERGMASMKWCEGTFRWGISFGFILSLAALRPDPAVVVVFAPEAIAVCSFKQATKLVKSVFSYRLFF